MAKILGNPDQIDLPIEPFDTKCHHCHTPYQADNLSDIWAQYGTVQPFDRGVVFVKSICPACKERTPVPSDREADLAQLMGKYNLIKPEH